jgi:hydrogenase maturation protein HypF
MLILNRKLTVAFYSFAIKKVDSTKKAILIHIRGLVQGVGFRPFIYRIAFNNNILGWVENNNEGVTIHAEGTELQIDRLIQDIYSKAPLAASIGSLIKTKVNPEFFTDFSIKESASFSQTITEVSPDIAVCDDCLNDLLTQIHRLGYPFINCTNCGPRFTIVQALPYDRHHTTMRPFEMCPVCKVEYENILDRRFHAQPIACNHCGPEYHIENIDLQIEKQEIHVFIANEIQKGKIIALKGMGGYHFICDADNEQAVKTLRNRKQREKKPFAVMCKNLQTIENRFEVSEQEKNSLISWRRPIVLLKNKKPFAQSVSMLLNTTGILLPSMPIHHQIFDFLTTNAIVFTSGNMTDEPVCIDDSIALNELSKVADIVITYNREIHNRADDSVVMVVNEKERLIRRSKGYVPAPVLTTMYDNEGIFAAGAELTNTFALGKERQVIFSQHIGDLKNAETMEFYEESINRFSELFRFENQFVACDLHPDYLSSNYARCLGLPALEIQHHHAHIASCMAEHGLNEKVIGFAFDGTGYGDDGTIWGGEVFICDYSGYERRFHFDPVPLPGGDQVTKYPWRTALSYLYKYFGDDVLQSGLPFLLTQDKNEIKMITQMIDAKLNCPLSSGAGRLFDAVAALSEICTTSSYHAEAPMKLESCIETDCKGKYLYHIEDKTIIFYKMFYQIMKDIHRKVPASRISTKFHNTMVALIVNLSKQLKKETGINKVVLSGGTFQNKYLLGLAEILLIKEGFEVFSHEKIPSNDGGIALGQMAIAAVFRQSSVISNNNIHQIK